MDKPTPTVTPPSPLRWPLTIILGMLVPPLGLAAWIFLSGADRIVYLRSAWTKTGVGLLCLGVLPLLTISFISSLGLLPDPSPNPIGLGLFFLAVGMLGCCVIFVGILRHSFRRSA